MGHRKSGLRDSIKKMMREIRRAVWIKSRSPAKGNRHKGHLHRSRIRVKKKAGPDLRFDHDSPWGWSLKIYNQEHLLGTMQASTPVSCFEVIAPYFAGNRQPNPEYKILICCNANHRQLKLNRATFERLNKTLNDPAGDQILEFFGDHFERDLYKIKDSSSVTVMVDENNEVVDTISLLKTVFSP